MAVVYHRLGGAGVFKLAYGDVYDGKWMFHKKNGRGEGESDFLS